MGFSDGCGSGTGSRNCSEIADASKEKFSLFTIELLFNPTLRAIAPTVTLLSHDKCERFFAIYMQAGCTLKRQTEMLLVVLHINDPLRAPTFRLFRRLCLLRYHLKHCRTAQWFVYERKIKQFEREIRNMYLYKWNISTFVSFGVEPLILESRAKCLAVSVISVSRRLEVGRAKRWCKGWFRKLRRGRLSRARLKRAVNAAMAAETARALSTRRERNFRLGT